MELDLHIVTWFEVAVSALDEENNCSSPQPSSLGTMAAEG